jgi:condensin complex subunit 2
MFILIFKENVPENNASDNVFKESVTKPCTFTELYHTIPGKISKQMANNLSIATAFVCLLHLANEKVV